MTDIKVAALYKFVALPDFEAYQAPLREVCDKNGVRGTLLLAHEGLNGTIAGPSAGIDAVLKWLRAQAPFADLDVKFSHANEMPFLRMKVRLKREIVTMGVTDIDPNKVVGTYVDPIDWNALISDPDTLVIDTRNDYETGIGMFEGAVDPDTKTFRDFPEWADDLKNRIHNDPPKKIAMYCTGGIRCEKSTAYMKKIGFENVFHLKGGILKYLETVPKEESLWKGECFVFDQRVSVGHGLELGEFDQCFACRRPITEEDKNRPEYVKGVSCHQCIDEFKVEDRERFAERQKQIELSRKRGEAHIGAKPAE